MLPLNDPPPAQEAPTQLGMGCYSPDHTSGIKGSTMSDDTILALYVWESIGKFGIQK